MQPITLFILKTCPYCVQALRWMDELYQEHPEYHLVPVTTIDEGEQPDVASRYDYYYVPTYYIGDKKITEGVQTKEKIQAVFISAMSQA